MKKAFQVVGIIIASFIGLCMWISILGSDKNDRSKVVTKNGIEQVVKGEVQGNIGDTVQAGSMEYKVIKASIVKEVKGLFREKTYPESGQFLVVDIIIKNVGKEQIHVSHEMIKLVDDNEAEYTMSQNLSTSGSKGHFIYEEMNPNAIKKAKLVFDTCKKDASLFKVYAYPKRFSSSDPAVIQLIK